MTGRGSVTWRVGAALALALALGGAQGAARAADAEPAGGVALPTTVAAAPMQTQSAPGLPAARAGQRVVATTEGDRSGPAGGAAMLAGPGTAAQVELGRRIYHEGIGASGQPIVGLRFGGIESRGAAVACVNCHRRSGLGAVEGTEVVAPVAGRFIFQDEQPAVASMNRRTVKGFNQRHAAFDAAGFAAAVTQGRHLSGRELSLLMPRYDFNATELAALQAYLRTLSAQWSPGVTARRLRLATVITPDVSPQRRAVFLETVRAAVAQKNGNFMPGMRTMSSAAEMLLRSDRHWDLQVWALSGPPDTWARQLDERQAAEPVFALVSGLGAGEWAPVHAFCERQAVPCWFPSVDAPPVQAERATAVPDFYSVYFSAGLGLEAEALARHLAGRSEPARQVALTEPAPGPQRPARVVQWHRGDSAGRAGAERLRAAMAEVAPGVPVLTRVLPPAADSAIDPAAQAAQAALPALSAAWQAARDDLRAGDALMLWWPADALGELAAAAPPVGVNVYASARLAGDDVAAVPAAWAAGWQLVDAWQLPQQRVDALFYFKAWLQVRQLPLRDEVLQSEVFFALTYLAETLTDMIDNVHRDYLIERAESMLSLREGQRSEDESREQGGVRYQKGPGGAQGAAARMGNLVEVRKIGRPLPGQPLPAQARREGTTVYPRLGLGQGQRLAAKAARIVRLELGEAGDAGAAGDARAGTRTWSPLTDWIVP